jgi:YVTN family beta-propeller protein
MIMVGINGKSIDPDAVMRRTFLPILLPALLTAAACGTGSQSLPSVAGEPITSNTPRAASPGFSVKPPQGQGWVRLSAEAMSRQAAAYKIAFGKSLGAKSTAIAGVGAIAAPVTVDNPRELLRSVADSRIKRDIEEAQKSGRFRVALSRAASAPRTDAACWREDLVAEDRGVPGHEGEAFTLTIHRIYCLHPDYPAYVIYADFSQRIAPGEQSPSAEQEGEGFLQSLEFQRLGRHIVTIPVGEKVQGIAYTSGAVWVAYGRDQGMVARIDTRSNRVVARIHVGKWPIGVAAETGAIWVVNNGDDTVSRIDPTTNEVVVTIPVGKKPQQIALGAGAAWVTNSADGTVSRIDRTTDQALAIRNVAQQPSGVAVNGGVVLVTDYNSDKLVRIDPRNNAVVDRIASGSRSNFIWPDGDGAWVNDQGNRAVLRLDLNQPNSAPLKIVTAVGVRPTGLALDGQTLWVANWGDDTLSAIDTENEARSRVLPAGSRPLCIVSAEGRLWVTDSGDDTVLRLDP